MKKLNILKIFRFNNVIIPLLLFIHFILLLNIKFTAWPELIAWPYLMLKGWLPYKDIAIAHTPILLVALTIFYKMFSVGIIQLKIFTWILVIFTDLLVYFVAKKLFNEKIAILALLLYTLLQIVYEGNGLWFDLALAPLVLLLYYTLKSDRYFWSGVIFALSFFTKQTAFWLIFPILIFFLKNRKSDKLKIIISFTEGFLCLTLLVFISVVIFKIFPDFMNWSINFGIFYLPKAEGQIHLPTIKQLFLYSFPFVIIIPMFFINKIKNIDLLFWTFFALMGIVPRFELFHFQPALTFLAISMAAVFMNISKEKRKLSLLLIFSCSLGIIFLFGKSVTSNWKGEDRFYGQNELNISSFVKSKVNPDEKIYVANYWDSIYAMTNTLPATKPLVPYLPWYLKFGNLQEKLTNDLKMNMPALILKGEYSKTGLGSYQIEDLDKFVERFYTLTYKNQGVEVYTLNK